MGGSAIAEHKAGSGPGVHLARFAGGHPGLSPFFAYRIAHFRRPNLAAGVRYSTPIILHHLLLLAFFLTVPLHASPALDGDTSVRAYACRMTLSAAAGIADTAAVRLALEQGGKGGKGGKGGSLLVSVTRAKITAVSVMPGGRENRIGEVAADILPGAAAEITVLREGDWLGILHDAALLACWPAPRGSGGTARITPEPGWKIAEAHIERREPVAFADDFMRTAENERGQWTPRGGTWRLQSAWDDDPHGNEHRFDNAAFAQRAFSWAGSATPGPAYCTTGLPTWDDYTLTLAVQPAARGAVGALVNLADDAGGLLVRWTPGNDPAPTGNRLALYQRAGAKLTLLADSPGGYIPGQWYALAISTGLDGVRVSIDGRERLALATPPCWHGGVGLWAEGAQPAVFADVTVYGHGLNTDLLRETRQAHVTERFQSDPEMTEWAAADTEWQPCYAGIAGYRYRDELYGDYWLTCAATIFHGAAGELRLLLHTDGDNPASGYRFVLRHDAKTGEYTGTLYRNDKELARKRRLPLKPDEEYTFRLRRQEGRVWLECDGARWLEARDTAPLPGGYPAYGASGCFAIGGVHVTGTHWLDYSFATAPTDWIGVGTWMPTVRWSCQPKWSFLGGWSRGDAILWHKACFTGDQALQAYVGPKMEYPREREPYDRRFRDYGLTLCGDGHDPRSGYAAIYGAASPDGIENSRTVLLRNGVEVASAPLHAVTFQEGGHHVWHALMLRKHGDLVEFRVGGEVVCRYRDPHPLAGGVPAIWTHDNGIMVARARLDFAEAPQPRTDPTVVLDTPWYPEWANVGRPLTLDFGAPWSTTGNPVSLTAVPCRQPAAGAEVVIDHARLTLTPRAPGAHWYTVAGDDGAQRSPDFHLALPAFTPALGRDDSHALLLYRFDEGQGTVVHDRATTTPPLDLTIPANARTQWLPGRGLALRGPATIASAAPAGKLMALAARKAGTVEAWVSSDTLCPPSLTSGCLLSWETGPDGQNLAILHQFFSGSAYMTAVVVAPRRAGPWRTWDPQPLRVDGFHIGLCHLVVTWDGTNTTVYLDGARATTAITCKWGRAMFDGFRHPATRPFDLPWHPEEWDPTARLFLGSLGNGQRYFLGAYYLLAIHDTCLTPEQVMRHYQAGPDG